MDVSEKTAKPHRKHVTGRKAEKRKSLSLKEKGENTAKPNPKAFAVQRVNKLNRTFRRLVVIC